MNDYLESSVTTQRVEQKAQNFIRLLRSGDCNLTKLLSNVPEVAVNLKRNTKIKNVKVSASVEDTWNVLGLKWNYESDIFIVSRGASPEPENWTT